MTVRTRIYASLLKALRLNGPGAAFMVDRGFEPDVAYRYGFRVVATPAAWRKLSLVLHELHSDEDLERVGLATLPAREWRWHGTPAALVIPYRFEGRVVGLRWRNLAPDCLPQDRYRDLPDNRPPVPFNADALEGAGELHICEGELNAYTLGSYGLQAIGLPGAFRWRSQYTNLPLPSVHAVDRLVLWYADDATGKRARAKLTRVLDTAFGPEWLGERARSVTLAGGDVNDAHRAGDLASVLDRAEWRR